MYIYCFYNETFLFDLSIFGSIVNQVNVVTQYKQDKTGYKKNEKKNKINFTIYICPLTDYRTG